MKKNWENEILGVHLGDNLPKFWTLSKIAKMCLSPGDYINRVLQKKRLKSHHDSLQL